MTLTHGAYIISKLVGTSLGDVVTIGTKRAQSLGRSRAAIDIDVSYLGYRFSGQRSGPVGKIVAITSALCREGFLVRWVADGRVRSYVKRASAEREAERQYTREVSKQAMADLLHARTRLRDVAYASADEKASIDTEIRELEKIIAAAERKSDYAVPSDFSAQL
mmetsp:Transcript_3652/g.8283  ORF Transcript_3652/g.8283 Transcript_3652/m.8283 type:complete len:164 (+) Transcript_3652:309-800(+)